MKRLSIKSRLLLTMVLITTISCFILIIIGYLNGRDAILESNEKHLTSVRAAKQYQIEKYFSYTRNTTNVFGSNSTIKQATIEFIDAFNSLQSSQLKVEISENFKSYYDLYIDKLAQHMNINKNRTPFYPRSDVGVFLQNKYIIDNENPLGDKHFLSDTKENFKYNQVHKKYHPYFRQIIENFGFYDMFLVDLEKGNIVYSVFKEADYATNLYDGPYRESNLAKLVKQIKSNTDITKPRIIDFEFYRPSYGAPAAFMGIPLTEDNKTIGALVFQLPIDEINNIMTGNQNWVADGLGASGETYLVGEDFLMRSVSRFFLEDSIGYTDALLDIGVTQEYINKMYHTGTNILLQRVKTDGVISAFKGEKETRVIDDYRSVPVLSSYSQVNISGLNWVILSEIDEAEANQPIKDFQQKVFIALIIILLITTFLSMFLSGQFVKSIEILMSGVDRLRNKDYSKNIEINTNDEFEDLAYSFNQMVRDLSENEKLLFKEQEENKKLLLNFIPETVVQKLQNGELNIANSYPNVSLIVIDIVGFSQISEELGPNDSITILNELVSFIDTAAKKHQIEKIRTIGNTYFATSGMLNPRLDHAKKSLEFSKEIRQLIIQFNINQKMSLQLKTTIHSGPVMAGIVGVENYNYDLWGETVSDVFRLNEKSTPDEILVTPAVYEALNTIYNFDKVDVGFNDDVYKLINKTKNNSSS